MAIPKFNELSTGIQIILILVLGVALGAAIEYVFLRPIQEKNKATQATVDQLAQEVAPLRPFEARQKQLIEENRQLEIQLANLQRIVPEDKEVDGFVRLVNGASNQAGVDMRRFTSKPLVRQDYYTEVPFETELDGPYYQVMGFFDRLSRMERIVNVTNLKMGSIKGGKSVGNKTYEYDPNETVVAVCTMTTFFSSDEQPAPVAVKPGAKPPAKPRAAPAPKK
jgi:type IV pilus assembly protein PilO